MPEWSKSKYEKHIGKKIDKFMEIGRQYGYWDRGYDYPRMCQQVYQGVSLKGKNILEIGCGNGMLSIWAGMCEASSVVALEPLEDGSGSFNRSRVFTEFNSITEALDIKNANIISQTVQDYQEDMKFDVVLSNASINHLDEDSCINLKTCRKSRCNYINILKGIANKMKIGGKLIVIDCSSRNFINDIGLVNPLMKSIEWHKHHTPHVWQEICAEADFLNPVISWPSGRYLRYLRIYKRPQLFSYFIDSVFRLEMTCMRHGIN